MEPGGVILEGSMEEAALKPAFEGVRPSTHVLENVSSMRARAHLSCDLYS